MRRKYTCLRKSLYPGFRDHTIPKDTTKGFQRPMMLLLLLLLFIGNSYAQYGPCQAYRYNSGDGWRWDATKSKWISTKISSPNDQPQGVVSCDNAAATNTIPAVSAKGIYHAADFPISTSCGSPREGQEIIWFNFDIQALAGTFAFQLQTGYTWALYHSDVSGPSTPGVNTGDKYPLSGVSGDCSNAHLVQDMCLIQDANGWGSIVTPSFKKPTNYYLAIWKPLAPGDLLSKANFASNEGINFKSRHGCGGETCILQFDRKGTECSSDGSKYTACATYFGNSGRWNVVDNTGKALSYTVTYYDNLHTPIGSPVTTTTAPTVTLGTVAEAVEMNICVLYPATSGYNIQLNPDPTYSPDNTYVQCQSGDINNFVGSAPGCCINPTALVLTGHDFCSSVPGSGSITSSTSTSGVNYQLYDGSNNTVQTAQSGTGSGLTWSGLSAGTGYYVIATVAGSASCSTTSGTVDVVQVSNPTALVLTGHDFCSSSPNTGSITSSTSANGVSYQLYNSSNTKVQAAQDGTGSGLSWTGLSAGTGYYVIATGSGTTACTSTSGTVDVVQVSNPTALVLTGHDFCSSSPNTGSITSSTSANGVSYQLYNSSNTKVQAAQDGTGSGLSWTGLSAGTGYYVIATGSGTTACTSTSGTVDVVQVSNPTALVLTGHDFCSSSPNTGSITSSTSANGVSYQLYNSSNTKVQAAQDGTGSGLSWTGLSAGTGYYVIATGSGTTACTSTSGTVDVVQVSNPTALVLTGHDFCSSSPNTGSITSSTSANGVSYQLYNSSNTKVQAAQDGTGSGLSWTGLSAGTGYYVIATGSGTTACTSTSGTVDVVQVSNPTALVLTGHDFCSSSPNTGSITSSTSANGVSYQLYNSSNTKVQAAQDGTGSGLSWTGLSAGTGYYVIATGSGTTACTSTSGTVDVVQVSNPTALVLTGHDFCSSSPNTGSITSSTSANGVSYQLYNSSNTKVQAAQDGTGSGLSWTGLSAGTGYYVIATGSGTTACTSTSGTVDVVQVSNPTALVLTGHDFCSSSPNTGSITSSTSANGVSYQLYNSSNTKVQAAQDGTGSGLSWTGLSAGTGYYVIATGSGTTACTSTSGTVDVVQVSNPTALVLTGHDFCSSSPNTGSITSSTSANGVSYQLYNSSNTKVQAAQDGTGSGLSWTGLSAGTGYYVIATGSGTTACTSTSGTVDVVQVSNPTALVLTGHDFCSSSPNTGSITSSTSANGVSYQLYNSSNTKVQAAQDGTGSGLSWTGLSAGTGYYVIATGSGTTACTSTSGTVDVVQVSNPTALVLTGHDFCSSSPNTGSITSSTSANGVSYQLYNSSNTKVQAAQDGTGSGLSWTGLSAGTGYYVIATGSGTTACTSTSGTVDVVQVSNPTALVLTGHDFCSSSPNTGSITSSTSANGVSYQLYNSSNTKVQAAQDGTGSGLSWTGLSAGTGYYVIATGSGTTACTSTSGTVDVVQVSNPTALVLTGHDFCSSSPNTGSITSSTSANGVSYQLYNSSNTKVQAAQDGTGSGLSWTGLSAGTGYYVIATGSGTTACTSTSGTVDVVQVSNPTALVLTGHDFCSSSPNTGSITSSTSANGVSYQLYNSSNTKVQAAQDGTGSGLSWTGLSAGTGYYVIATGSGTTACTSTSGTVDVVQVSNPTALVLTGHDFCSSSPNTGSITSSTSANGVSYQLYNSSNTKVQAAQDGTGSGLSWTGLSAGTGYYVIATGSGTTACTSTSGTVDVVQVSNPTALVLTGHDFCSSSPNTGSITSSTSANGVSYQLYNSSNTKVQAAQDGTGSGLSWTGLSAGTGYYVIATGSGTTACTSTSGTVDVVQVSNPTALVLTGHDFCSSSPNTGSITSSTSANGVSYQLYNSSNTKVQAAQDGTGSGLSWTGLSAGTGYYVIATGSGTTACTSTSGTVDVVQNQTPILVINNITPPCTPGTTDLTTVISSTSTLPNGTTLSYYNSDINGNIGTKLAAGAEKSVSAGTYWIKAATSTNPVCSDQKSVTIGVNNCGGLIYATATTCKDFLAGVNTLDKICYTVTATTKGNKTSYAISNATPGVFFYYARIQVPSDLKTTNGVGSITVNVLQFNTSNSVVHNAVLPNFAIQQGQVFAFDGTTGSTLCTKIGTGSESPKGSGNATITLNVMPNQIIVLSVKYDVKTLVGKAIADIIGPDYQAYFISKVTYNSTNTNVTNLVTSIINSTAGNIRVYNCNAPVTNSITAARVNVTEQSISGVSVTAYPNPYTENVRFILQSPESGQGTLDIYNVVGQKIKTLYQGHITAGQPHNVEYHVPSAVQGTLLYFFKVNGKQVTGKLLNIKN